MSFVSYNAGPQPSIEVSVPAKLLNIDNFDAKMEEAIFEAAIEARNFWETTAGQRLNSSRTRYQEAIGMEQVSDTEVHLKLTTPFAVAIENGWTQGDQKPGFLASSKIKAGPVRKIPRAIAAKFQHNRPACTKWMIIPLNTQRKFPMGRPGAFRTFTDKQTGMWPTNAKTRKGVFIAKDVADELGTNILPKHIEKVIDELVSQK